MNLSFRTAVSVGLIAAYVVAGALIEVGHHDALDFCFNNIPALTPHQCGATEVHIPLSKRHDCLACAQSAQRIAAAPTPVPVTIIQVICLRRIILPVERTLRTDFLHSGKRGPPLHSL